MLSGIMGMTALALALAGLGFLVPRLLGATWRRKCSAWLGGFSRADVVLEQRHRLPAAYRAAEAVAEQGCRPHLAVVQADVNRTTEAVTGGVGIKAGNPVAALGVAKTAAPLQPNG